MTVRALIEALKGRLGEIGVEDPAFEAACILEQVLGVDHVGLTLSARNEIPQEKADEAKSLAERRKDGEPLQYILGSWDFYGRRYAVGKGVLIPRDDTEVVVRASLDLLKGSPSPAILDLCAGTGIIAITLQKELAGATVTAVEKSDAAFSYLEENIRRHRAAVTPIHADLCDCVDTFADHSLDLIVSNPPYVKSGEIDSLSREVAFEPRLALDGGETGYDFYEQIIALYADKIKSGGYFAFEIGEGQCETVSSLLNKAGFDHIESTEDLGGIPRALLAQKRK